MEKQQVKKLKVLFENWSGSKAKKIEMLPPSGSYREYYRIYSPQKTVIGSFNADLKENIAFITFSKHFFSKGLPVPEILAEDLENNIYLQSDLGDTTLFAYLTASREGKEYTADIVDIYKKVIEKLPLFQVVASKDIDYSVCYPRDSFDKQSMMWDVNYFKYYFLKLAQIPFDEQELEDDFQTFTDYLLQADRDYFLYRDFQSRNVMIYENNPYFIDYQGGRRGALQYDLASLLYDGKADMPQEIRNMLLEYYIDNLSEYIPVKKEEFRQYYIGYVFIRIMQAMGAYGFRGFYENKAHFLQSIPYAINNLKYLLEIQNLPVKIPTLINVLHLLTKSEKLQQIGRPKNQLLVTITSFSYKKGLPEDKSGNGGGYIFDCRAINNPGRYNEYKELTGRDGKVIDFLENKTDIENFLEHSFALVDNSVQRYIDRKFTNLMVSYGCTGGQHRSVYAADRLGKYLKQKFDNIDVEILHREQAF